MKTNNFNPCKYDLFSRSQISIILYNHIQQIKLHQNKIFNNTQKQYEYLINVFKNIKYDVNKNSKVGLNVLILPLLVKQWPKLVLKKN